MVAPEDSDLGLTPQNRAEIRDKGRWLRRVVNPFVDFYVIMAIGAAGSPTTSEAAQSHEDRNIRDLTKDMSTIQLKIYAEDFTQITGSLPFLKNRLESNEASRVIRKITHRAQSIADQGKQSDTKNIKYGIILLIPKKYFPPGDDGDTAINVHKSIHVDNPNSSKAWRGWANPATSRLLCPVEYIAQFKANPEDTREKLMQGELPLTDNIGDPKFPSFLYDEDTLDGSFAKGLLRGPVLLAVYTSIFISPSGATGAKASSKRGNARIHGMTKVIPSTICYAAIHTYIALCCRREWGEEWKGVKLPRLYILLREQFAHPDDPWCVDTLKWWNEKVFEASTELDKGLSEGARDTEGPSMRERLDNERRERMIAGGS